MNRCCNTHKDTESNEWQIMKPDWGVTRVELLFCTNRGKEDNWLVSRFNRGSKYKRDAMMWHYENQGQEK